VNKSFGRVLGYSRAEALGVKFPYPWLIEEEMDASSSGSRISATVTGCTILT